MCEDICFWPTGQIQLGARRQEIKTGLRYLGPVFAGQKHIEFFLELVQELDIRRGIVKQSFVQLRSPPITMLQVL